MIFPHFIAGVPSTADSQPMFGEKMREIPVTISECTAEFKDILATRQDLKNFKMVTRL